MRPIHLAKRFFGSLRPGGPGAEATTWVAGALSPAELALWAQMSGPDRRHSHQVARDVERALGHEATAPVLAAALLHDVGKLDAGLRTYGRVIATLSAAVGRPRDGGPLGPPAAASPARSASTSATRAAAATCSSWPAATR